MELNTIKPAQGAMHAKRRVGRGIGSRSEEHTSELQSH